MLDHGQRSRSHIPSFPDLQSLEENKQIVFSSLANHGCLQLMLKTYRAIPLIGCSMAERKKELAEVNQIVIACTHACFAHHYTMYIVCALRQLGMQAIHFPTFFPLLALATTIVASF